MAAKRYCEMCDKWVSASQFECRACGMPTRKAEPEPERDEAYERAAARARLNDFEDTDGRDWT